MKTDYWLSYPTLCVCFSCVSISGDCLHVTRYILLMLNRTVCGRKPAHYYTETQLASSLCSAQCPGHQPQPGNHNERAGLNIHFLCTSPLSIRKLAQFLSSRYVRHLQISAFLWEIALCYGMSISYSVTLLASNNCFFFLHPQRVWLQIHCKIQLYVTVKKYKICVFVNADRKTIIATEGQLLYNGVISVVDYRHTQLCSLLWLIVFSHISILTTCAVVNYVIILGYCILCGVKTSAVSVCFLHQFMIVTCFEFTRSTIYIGLSVRHTIHSTTRHTYNTHNTQPTAMIIEKYSSGGYILL